MTYTSAAPGVRCFIETAKDSAKCATWSWFQEPCFGTQFIRLQAPQGSSPWFQPLNPPGVLLLQDGIEQPAGNKWRGDFITLGNASAITLTLFIYDLRTVFEWPSVSVEVNCLEQTLPTGPKREEKWQCILRPATLRGPHQFTNVINDPPNIEIQQPFLWEWWPSCDGNPEPGPRIPTFPPVPPP